VTAGGGQAGRLGWLQYQLGTDTSIATGLAQTNVVQTLSLTTDLGSLPASLFDKPSATQFRALVPMYARVSYGAVVTGNNNEQGFMARVLLNGAGVAWSESGGSARQNSEVKQVKRTLMVQLAAGDVLSLQGQTNEGLTTDTFLAAGTFMLVECAREL
jgi:hypothetical protein